MGAELQSAERSGRASAGRARTNHDQAQKQQGKQPPQRQALSLPPAHGRPHSRRRNRGGGTLDAWRIQSTTTGAESEAALGAKNGATRQRFLTIYWTPYEL